MAQGMVAVVIGLQFIMISFLPLPILILGAFILSWAANLPSPVRHAIEMGLGSGYVGVVVAGMLGSVSWIIMVLLILCFSFADGGAVKGSVLIFVALVAVVLWVVYAIETPWHPESKLSLEVLSAPTVLTGCREILALKYLIVVNLSIVALFLLTLVGEINDVFGKQNRPRPRRPATTLNVNIPTNGAAKRLAQPKPNQEDLEAGKAETKQCQQTTPTQAQTLEKPAIEPINMAGTDGTG